MANYTCMDALISGGAAISASVAAADNAGVVLGTGNDVTIKWDGTDLLMNAAAASLWKIGDGTYNFDVKLFGSDSSHYISFDASADDLKLEDSVSLMFGTGAGAGPGTAGDIEFKFDGTDMQILGASDNLVFKWGATGNSFDQIWYGSTSSNYLLFDTSANLLSCVGAAAISVKAPVAGALDTGAATQPLTAAQSGGVFICAADAVMTLPATVAGLTYTFVTGTLSVGTGLSISPNANDYILSTGLTAVNDKDLINTGATDVVGDCVTLVGDGVHGWVVTSMRGTWAKEG